MSAFERILPYLSILQRVNGDYIVITTFRKEWLVEKSKDGMIDGRWSDSYDAHVFMAHENEVSFDRLCTYIQETIDINKEAEAKSVLFEKKKKELTDLFKEKSLLELEGLDFNIVNIVKTSAVPSGEPECKSIAVVDTKPLTEGVVKAADSKKSKKNG